MGEDVDLGPAGEVEQSAVGKEIEAGLGQGRAAFALEPLVELLLHLVEVAHVGGGIILLGVGEVRSAPVGGLLRSEERRVGKECRDWWSAHVEVKYEAE